MFVVLETNAIHLDYRLSNPETMFLLDQAPARNIIVCIPQVVLLEMVADFREDLAKALQQWDQVRKNLSRLLPRSMVAGRTVPDLESAVATYEQRFRKILSKQKVQIMPLPADAGCIKRLVRRAVAKRKPFDQNGRGVCDAVLWESVLELCRGQTRQLALITDNTKDFADPNVDPPALHPHLVEDLREIGFTRPYVLSGNTSLHENIAGSPGAELHKTIKNFNAARLRYLNTVVKGDTARRPPEG